MKVGSNWGTVEDRLKVRANNFDMLRFLAASFVIVSHSFALLKFEQPNLGRMTLGSMGVNIFFIISGFLIAKSWHTHPRASAFIGKRLLRIVPGLVGVTLFTVLILGPLLTSLSLKDYLTDPATNLYLLNSFIFPLHYELPGLFWTNIGGSIVNGAIWTLPFEFIAYLGLIGLAYLGIFKRQTGFVLLVAIITAVTSLLVFLIRDPEAHFAGLKILWLVKYGGFFMMGTAYYIYRDKIILSDKLALLAFAVILAGLFLDGQFVLTLLALPYLILYLALMPAKYASRFGAWGDFSYGMYIYGWPTQQVIIQLMGGSPGILRLLVLEFPVIIALAAVSWHLIERPSLKLKRYFNLQRYPVLEPVAVEAPAVETKAKETKAKEALAANLAQ